MVIPKTTASKDVGRSVPRRYRFSPRISATAARSLDALSGIPPGVDRVGALARDVGIKKAKGGQSHDSRGSKRDFIVGFHIAGNLLHRGTPKERGFPPASTDGSRLD